MTDTQTTSPQSPPTTEGALIKLSTSLDTLNATFKELHLDNDQLERILEDHNRHQKRFLWIASVMAFPLLIIASYLMFSMFRTISNMDKNMTLMSKDMNTMSINMVTMSKDMSTMTTHMASMSKDMNTMSTDMGTMSKDMANMTKNVRSMDKGMRYMTHDMRYMSRDMNEMTDSIAPVMGGVEDFMPWTWRRR